MKIFRTFIFGLVILCTVFVFFGSVLAQDKSGLTAKKIPCIEGEDGKICFEVVTHTPNPELLSNGMLSLSIIYFDTKGKFSHRNNINFKFDLPKPTEEPLMEIENNDESIP